MMVTTMKAYLDTCVVSALAKSDMPAEQQALERLLNLHEQGRVELFRSAEVKDELSDIPEEYLKPHLEVFKRFLDLPRLQVGGLTRLCFAGVPSINLRRVKLNRLRKILPDKTDAMHILITATNRVKYLVTTDKKTILRHTAQVEKVSGVQTMLPSEFHKLLEGTISK